MSSPARTFEPIKVKDAGKYADWWCLMCGTLGPKDAENDEERESHICHRCAGNLLAGRYQGVAHLLDHGMINLKPFNDIDYGDLDRADDAE